MGRHLVGLFLLYLLVGCAFVAGLNNWRVERPSHPASLAEADVISEAVDP